MDINNKLDWDTLVAKANDGLSSAMLRSKHSQFFKKKREDCTAYEYQEANYLLGKIYLEGDLKEMNLSKAREYLQLANEDEDHLSAKQLLLLIGKS